mgnify:CR=1 FL=1
MSYRRLRNKLFYLKNVKLPIMLFILVVILMGGYIFYLSHFNDGSTLYLNKEKLCMDFARSYLQTVQNTDAAGSREDSSNPENIRWEMAIDIGTDLYNLCRLDLEYSSLESYKSVVTQKYSQ